MDNSNGSTEEISGRFKISGTETQREGLGETRHESEITGANTIIASGKDCDGGNIDWKLTPVRDTSAGKILERLNSLEARHLEYVDSHQARLKARLEESREEKEEFLQESNQIKSDIYHLAIAQNQANGNGHIN
jgi:hypothetical protein